MSSGGILAFVDAADREIEHMHSILLMRRGEILAEGYWDPYDAETPQMLFSLSKSFTSTAIGLLVAEGKLTVEDRVLDLLPDVAPKNPGANLAAMRVKHLLTMTTGHGPDPTRAMREHGPEWTRSVLALPVEHEPGTHFVYNTAATYLLAAIAQRLSGQRLTDYLRPRLFQPLGIENPVWETSPEGVNVGGWGLNLTTREVARFGELYLQRGAWEGKQLVPEAWVDEATGRRVPNDDQTGIDWSQGYGYQFWRCRHDVYRGDGAFGQFCIVFPKSDAVLAITAGTTDMQAILELVWKHLLPSLAEGRRLDPSEQRALEDRLARLRLSPPEGAASSSVPAGTYQVAPNDDGVTSVAFERGADCNTLVIRNDLGAQRIACGHKNWLRSKAVVERAYWQRMETDIAPPSKVAAAGAWTDDHTYVADLWWTETPFRRRLTCRFTGDRLRIDQAANVAFGPTERPRLEGRAAT